MKIIIEWFLLDNALMNGCIFLLASALSGIRTRVIPILLFSIGGAVYALLAMFYVPVLRLPWIKVVSFLLLGLPLYERGASILLTMLCVLFSAVAVGGAVLLVTLLTGGTVYASGAIVGTIPVRSSLVGLFLALLLPRIVRALLQKRHLSNLKTELVITTLGKTTHYRALIDTGNTLTEPISGLPVVLIADLSVQPERVVPYVTQGGEGVLSAVRAEDARLPAYGNCRIDCYLAPAMQPIPDADAILPAIVLPQEWRSEYEKSILPFFAAHRTRRTAHPAAPWARSKECRLVRALRRSAARAARSRGGSEVHCARADGEVGEGQTDRP